MYIIEIAPDNIAILREILPGASKEVHYSAATVSTTMPLMPCSPYPIETLALKMPLQVGRTYRVTGSWINYTRTNPPVFTLALTSAQLIEMPVPEPAE